jgi:hypothetical protein
MYGLVNRAVEDLISERFGPEAWERIKQRAGLDIDLFISMDAYPDDVTYRLVGAASEELGIPAEQLLEAFGEYWILYTAEQGYGELLRMGGDSLPEFLQNLHDLHSHVALSFPHLRPPSFWLSDVTAGSARLHYQSSRSGLAPMVTGLLKGLGKRFATPVVVEHARRRDDGAAHDEFLVRFGAAQ